MATERSSKSPPIFASLDSKKSGDTDDSVEFTNAILKELWPMMRVYAITLTNGDTHAVDEILQESALYIWERRNALPGFAKLRVWATRIVYFKALSYHRDRSRTLFIGFSEAVLDRLLDVLPEVTSNLDLRLDALTGCMGQLRKEDLRLLNQHYREKISLKKIAARLGKNENALWQHFFRLRRALRNCVGKKIAEAKEEF